MKKKNNNEIWGALIMVLQFGINMIVPIFMCTAFGIWIGDKVGINWICVPLFFVGALAGFSNIYKMSKRFIEPDKKGRNKEKDYVKKN